MNNIWRSYHGALIPWTPPHLGVNILREEIYADIIKSKSYFARWTTNFDTKTQSPFWYIINDKKVDLDLFYFFQQYLYKSEIPTFEYKTTKKGREYTLLYRWNAIDDFNMNIKVNVGTKDILLLTDNEWKEYRLGNVDIKSFKVRDDLFYVNVKKIMSK